MEVCDKCGKPAKYNLQLVWLLWRYNPETEEYSKEPMNYGDCEENFHYCEDCKNEK